MAESLSILKRVITVILSAELFLGGQARLPFSVHTTPRLHKHAMGKAVGTRDALWFVPIKDPTRHTNFFGVLMITAGGLLAFHPTRVPWGTTLTLLLTSAGVYSQSLMKIPYRLPVINSILALAIWWLESQGH